MQKTLVKINRDHNRSVIFHFSKAFPKYDGQDLLAKFKEDLQSRKLKIQHLNHDKMRTMFAEFLNNTYGSTASTEWQKYCEQ